MKISAITWTSHAELRLHQRGLTREIVESTLIECHSNRELNRGPADWRISTKHFVVVYDNPDGVDRAAARIVSVWIKRTPKRRSYP